MKIMKFVLALTLCFIASFGNAQLMEEKTQIMDSKGGKASFELEADVKVYSYPSTGVWYKISREAWIPKDQLIADEYLAEDTELFDKEGELIGKTIAEIKLSEKKLVEGFRGKDRYQIIISGFVYGSKFKDLSSPEKRVTEILAIKNKTKQKEAFEAIFELLDFEKKEYDGFTAYGLREDHKSLNEEKDYRMLVIFRGSSMVIAVFSNNGHSVSAPKIKDSFEDGKEKGIYILKLPAKQKALVEEEIRYDFLAL